jgi:hypothetical protein
MGIHLIVIYLYNLLLVLSIFVAWTVHDIFHYKIYTNMCVVTLHSLHK